MGIETGYTKLLKSKQTWDWIHMGLVVPRVLADEQDKSKLQTLCLTKSTIYISVGFKVGIYTDRDKHGHGSTYVMCATKRIAWA